MYLVHFDRLLTRYDLQLVQLAAAQYTYSAQIICSAWIFLHCLKLFYLNICSVCTSDSIYASYLNTLWYIRNAQILRVASSTALHAKNSCSSIYVFYPAWIFSDCLKLFYLNICSMYTIDLATLWYIRNTRILRVASSVAPYCSRNKNNDRLIPPARSQANLFLCISLSNTSATSNKKCKTRIAIFIVVR